MAKISRRYIDKYWVVPVRKLFYFHHWCSHMRKQICQKMQHWQSNTKWFHSLLLPLSGSSSGGVSTLGLGLQTRFLVSRSQSQRSQVSSLGLEGFRSRSRALRLETLHKLFFVKFCKKEFLIKTVLKNDCSKFSLSKRSVAKLSLLLCCLRDEENNLLSTHLKFILNSKKNVHLPKKPQRVISATRGWE